MTPPPASHDTATMETDAASDRPTSFDDLPKHISFVPQGRGSGLQVRIWRDGTRFQKFFALSSFQTPNECLRAAREWRDMTLAELPPAQEGVEQTEEVRKQISEKMTRTGIRGFGFQVGKKSGAFRLYATVQWRENDSNMSRMRSLHAHGIDGASAQLSRYLVEKIPEHSGADRAELAIRCARALRQLISRIYQAGHYPPSRHGHEEERYNVLAGFVRENDSLPVRPPASDT